MDFEFIDPWHLFLPREAGHVLTAVGGGGRGDFLAAIADVLSRDGTPVDSLPDGAPDEEHPDRLLLAEAGPVDDFPVILPPANPLVLPRRSSLVLIVIGLSALGRPAVEILDGASDRWRDLDPDETWTWDHYLRLFDRDEGWPAVLPSTVPRVIALLELRKCEDSLGLFGFLDRLHRTSGVPLIVMGDVEGEEPKLRTTCVAPESIS